MFILLVNISFNVNSKLNIILINSTYKLYVPNFQIKNVTTETVFLKYKNSLPVT